LTGAHHDWWGTEKTDSRRERIGFNERRGSRP
jgi:hypothetical protein